MELSEEIPSVAAMADSGRRYSRVLALVRLHSRVLGILEAEMRETGLGADEYARLIWDTFGDEINAHLEADGLDRVPELPVHGLEAATPPRCIAIRAELLSNAPSVTVMIATRERTDVLADCLSSILACDYPDFDIVVVDNAPVTDATRELITKRFSESRVIYDREELPGLAVAHNRGLAHVTGSIVAITDDDVIVDREWLAEIVRAFVTRLDVGCVTGTILPYELETPAQGLLEQYGGYSKGFETRVFDLVENRPASKLYPYAAGMFGSGANMSFRTRLLHRLGGFDAALGAGSPARGGDDLAAFLDVILAGHAVVYEPSAVVWHRHRRDYADMRNQAFSYGVGLTAFLTKVVFDRPRTALSLMARASHGVAHAVRPNSPKNRHKRSDYPPELTRQERYGMLLGPSAYARGRFQRRRQYGGKRARSAQDAADSATSWHGS